MKEQVNHPAHYNAGRFEVIDVIEDWQLGFSLGNAVKYIARAPHKGDPVQDLRKAAWYLQREIERIEQANKDAAFLQRAKELFAADKATRRSQAAVKANATRKARKGAAK